MTLRRVEYRQSGAGGALERVVEMTFSRTFLS